MRADTQAISEFYVCTLQELLENLPLPNTIRRTVSKTFGSPVNWIAIRMSDREQQIESNFVG